MLVYKLQHRMLLVTVIIINLQVVELLGGVVGCSSDRVVFSG